MAECIFCKIIQGEIPSSLTYEDELVVAFPDLYPKACVHLLIVPREHISSIAGVGPQHSVLLMRLAEVANRLANREGIAATGYRLVTNAGSDAGQAVQHLHVHLLGGEKLGDL